MEEEGLTAETEDTGLRPDAGFRHNPAETGWKPDLSKYDPALREQLGKDIVG